ncbi:MAG: penicillin-binding protein [Bryobacterales bacterium]|nr:penicillin-binding protein [Bryobacterales bacterium]
MTNRKFNPLNVFLFLAALALFGSVLTGAPTPAKKKTAAKPGAKKAVASSAAKKKKRAAGTGGFWTEPTFADSTAGDSVDGEDLDVRRAAVESLGKFNGSVVVANPESGRILTMVNQKLALGGGFQPCSTIKIPVALAALSEGIIDRNTPVRVYGKTTLNLTHAIAKSNNPYFANLGIKLGYERVAYYAHLFGLGEKAGLDIEGEHAGRFPKAPPKNGGVGMLTSFGEEISLTPLQLTAFMSAIANQGTLYYLQYPRSQSDVASFTPRVKRRLDIQRLIPEVRPGMFGAVEFGTARRGFQADVPFAGKTGTCSEARTHLGWFGSFNDSGPNKLVVVVLLTGGKPSIGPQAAGIAGDVYRRLAANHYFTGDHTASRLTGSGPESSTQACCGQ